MQKKPAAIILLIVGCALIGAVCRFVFLLLGWKMFVAAGVAMILVCIIMKSVKLFVPPAAALSVLAFLIPEEAVITYPLQIAAGTIFFVLVGRIFGKIAELRTPER